MTRATPGAVLLLAMVVVPTGWSQQRVWSPRQVSAAAPARGFAASAFDTARNTLVVFGGTSTVQPFTLTADTFEWDGLRWTQRSPANSPPARVYHALSYDERRQEVILFGGQGSSGPLGDTWVWDGNDWTQRFPSVSPAARAYHAMAYDRQRQRTVLFSGSNLSWPWYQDTWEWDGANWTRVAPPTQPMPRVLHSMAYFPPRGVVVMYGGQDSSRLFVDETWEWDGAAWTRPTPPAAPSPRVGASLAYHGDKSVIVLFGGMFSAAFADTWEWDGVQWTFASPSPVPPGRYGAVAGYDPIRRAVVLHGGAQNRPAGLLGDTWEYSLDPMVSAVRPLRIGATHTLTLASAADANRPFVLGTSLGTGPIPIGTRRLHLSADALLQVSAGGVLPTVFAGYGGVLDPFGAGAASITIPRIAALVGVALHTAFITLDSAAPLGIRSVSNTFSVVIAP